jgi:hypothetical protein
MANRSIGKALASTFFIALLSNHYFLSTNYYPLTRRITNVVDFAKNPVRQGRQTLSDFARRKIAFKDL